jgi:hypothetical protein
MFNYLFTATQFALVLLNSSYGRPILGCIADQKLRGLDEYGAILGLIQMIVLWIGSISLYGISTSLWTIEMADLAI